MHLIEKLKYVVVRISRMQQPKPQQNVEKTNIASKRIN